MEGRPGRAAMVDQQHQRIMEHLKQDPQVQGVNTGMFNTSAMMHQYGAGGQDLLLVSDPRTEPVAMTNGGKCPATAPVRQYDVSAINVEITLNQWFDFYPGYMYVLDENLDKVREEETKNRKLVRRRASIPEPSPWSAGAVDPAAGHPRESRRLPETQAQNNWKAGRTSACISMGLPWWSAPRAPRRRPRMPIVAQGKSQDFEWYIHPTTQEGGRQFHSYSNDRELTVMGLFGTFVVEPTRLRVSRAGRSRQSDAAEERLANHHQERHWPGLPRVCPRSTTRSATRRSGR